jgi:hypothetical protein
MYGQRLINEAEVLSHWGPIIEEATGIKDRQKLDWMSKYCHYHELYENQGTATLTSVNGMGAVTFPGDPTTQNGFVDQTAGSGDKPYTLLPLSMQVAAQTVGLDLVPVVPMGGPMGILTYLDFEYAGGKVGATGQTDNALMIKVDLGGTGGTYSGANNLTANSNYFIVSSVGSTSTGLTGDKALYTQFVGESRIDGFGIFRIISTGALSAPAVYAAADGTKISHVITSSPWHVSVASSATALGATVAQCTNKTTTASLVKALEDHVTGFSNNFDNNQNAPMSRATGETTQANVMNLKLYNKSVAAETFQVAAAVTREQVQDLKQFGIDAVAQVESALINELTQSINKNILDRLFKLGSTNHYQIYKRSGVTFFLNINTSATTLGTIFPSYATDFLGIDGNATFTTGVPLVATENASVSSAENLHTRQRKIMSKMLAASNMIAIRGRRGAATFAVTNGQVATALQDCAGFMPAPMANAIAQQGGSLYPVGTLAGLAIYVDPNMDWTDNRLCIGRKGDGNSPGLIFMPYLLGESVETIAEGTMAPKIAIKSRYTLVEAGQNAQTMYITTAVYSAFGSLV